MEANPPALSCLLAERDGTLIASFVGPITRACLELFEAAAGEILAKGAPRVILDFRDVPYSDRSVSPPARRLADGLRRQGRQFRFCSLRPSLKLHFTQERVAQPGEFAIDFADALDGMKAPKAA